MLTELVKKLPSADDLLRLAKGQLDAMLLQCVTQRATDPSPVATRYVHDNEIVGLYPIDGRTTFQRRMEADIALAESWQRLSTVGLIVPAPGQAPGMMTVTSRGCEVAGGNNFEEMMARLSLRPEMLHSDLRESVYENFSNGNYDTAVRDAFVLVEDKVRTAAGLPNSLVGVQLMRTAFDPNKGKLTDSKLVMAERERMADLFAGAIGTFKNPHSHRIVGNNDPSSVIEELMLASRLLRFVRP